MKSWITLIKERFHPALYIPTVFLFSWFNILVFTKKSASETNWWLLFLIFVPCLLFFFRLRLFDEIKDYEVDLKINPHRPLARGVLSVDQVKVGIISLILVESYWVYSISPVGFFFYTVAIMYSLLMYEEFFIGTWLRPKLTTYAITHTWVCAFLSIALGMSALAYTNQFGAGQSQLLDKVFGQSLSLSLFEKNFWIIAVMNWLYFNFFEFARKTFSKQEEKDTVASYSKIFGVWGAAALSFSQVLLAFGLWIIYRQHYQAQSFPIFSLALLIAAGALCVLYAFKNDIKSAKIFRGGCGLILLLQYVALIIEQGRI